MYSTVLTHLLTVCHRQYQTVYSVQYIVHTHYAFTAQVCKAYSNPHHGLLKEITLIRRPSQVRSTGTHTRDKFDEHVLLMFTYNVLYYYSLNTRLLWSVRNGTKPFNIVAWSMRGRSVIVYCTLHSISVLNFKVTVRPKLVRIIKEGTY